jgi:3-hydroxyacyl-CoA dehydrogenase/enoyl-CoA hydratase/3-hydroxybutyryl-CoA epimerase
VGADALLARLKTLRARHGERFAPRAGWDAAILREPVA